MKRGLGSQNLKEENGRGIGDQQFSALCASAFCSITAGPFGPLGIHHG